ncbi:MAG TPA: transglycosylase family protein, partial [Acidimicrobiia bacterium]|nr:transglycosylase family protein [Acidimicrobiia bacterium]
VSETSRRRKMRIDFRRSVFLSIGLVVTSSTLVLSDLMVSPADASVRRGRNAYHGRTVDREGIARTRIVRKQRATRSGTRSRLAPAPKPAAPRPVTAAANAANDEAIWQRLRNCEAGGRYHANSGNGYYGAYQFSARTWRGLGYSGLPHQAPPEIQDQAARKLQARSGWGQWPACSRRIGARR